jgi:hypothetical protein
MGRRDPEGWRDHVYEQIKKCDELQSRLNAANQTLSMLRSVCAHNWRDERIDLGNGSWLNDCTLCFETRVQRGAAPEAEDAE